MPFDSSPYKLDCVDATGENNCWTTKRRPAWTPGWAAVLGATCGAPTPLAPLDRPSTAPNSTWVKLGMTSMSASCACEPSWIIKYVLLDFVSCLWSPDLKFETRSGYWWNKHTKPAGGNVYTVSMFSGQQASSCWSPLSRISHVNPFTAPPRTFCGQKSAYTGLQREAVFCL